MNVKQRDRPSYSRVESTRLTDGRSLERVLAGATDDALNTTDLSQASFRDRRARILDLIRGFPQRNAGPVFVEQDGTRVQITQRIDRAMIVLVSKPNSLVFVLRTPLPSPPPRKADVDPVLGEVLCRAPAATPSNPLDDLKWEQLRLFLPPRHQCPPASARPLPSPLHWNDHVIVGHRDDGLAPAEAYGRIATTVPVPFLLPIVLARSADLTVSHRARSVQPGEVLVPQDTGDSEWWPYIRVSWQSRKNLSA